jgi:histidine ammonia-lyase
LALLNGTQFMNAYASLLTLKANALGATRRCDRCNDFTGCYDGRIEPFHASVHAVRPHPGQAVVAGHA